MAFPAIVAALGRAAATGGRAASTTGTKAMASVKPDLSDIKKEVAYKRDASIASKAFAKDMAAANPPTRSMSERMKEMYGTARKGAQDLAVAKYAFTDAAEGIAHKSVAAATALKKMADPINALVGMSNPAAVEQFNIAFNDAIAVMGRGMLPVTQAFTRAMRTLGDYYARLEPIVNRVSQAVGRGIDRVFGALDRAWKDSGPMMEMLGNVLVGVIEGLAMAFEFAVNALSKLVKMLPISLIARAAGHKALDEKSSMGASMRNVTTTTNAESISQRAMEKAMSMSLNKTTEEQQVDLTRDLWKEVEALRRWIMDNVPTITNIEKFINNLKPGKETMQKAEQFAGAAGAANPGLGMLLALRSAMTR